MSNSTVTKREEWQAQSEDFYPHFIGLLNTKATTVDDIETYYSLTGVKSLPARLDLGGVKKTVLVPVDLLTLDVKDRIEEAKQATENANSAASNAQTAADRANESADKVESGILDLTNEKAKVFEACEKAKEATEKATEATEATKRATEECESATQRANQAAEQANDASANANDAASRANDASFNAEEATKKAESATENANALMQDFTEAEQERKSNEEIRQSNEIAREENEAWRQTDYEIFKEMILGLVHEQDWNLLQQVAEEVKKIYQCRSLVSHGEWNRFYPWKNDSKWENQLNQEEEEPLACECTEQHLELRRQISRQQEVINLLIAEINEITGKEIPPLTPENSTTEE